MKFTKAPGKANHLEEDHKTEGHARSTVCVNQCEPVDAAIGDHGNADQEEENARAQKGGLKSKQIVFHFVK